MIEYKQPAIVEEIRRRIRCGIYTGQLPTTAELAEEFGVNIKTMSKAVSQLVDARILERRRRCGTRVISGMISRPEEELIEVGLNAFKLSPVKEIRSPGSIYIPIWFDLNTYTLGNDILLKQFTFQYGSI